MQCALNLIFNLFMKPSSVSQNHVEIIATNLQNRIETPLVFYLFPIPRLPGILLGMNVHVCLYGLVVGNLDML